MSARTVSFVFSLAVAALIATSTLAFEQLDPPRRWFPDVPNRTITVDDDGLVGVEDGGGVTEAVAAVEAWDAEATATMILNPTQGVVSGITLGDTTSKLAFFDPFFPPACARTCLAATFTGFFDEGSTALCDDTLVAEITDSDIIFNDNPGFGPFSFGYTSETEDPGGTGCNNEFYVEAITTHEVGHFIGLDHEDSVDALMNSAIPVCENKTLTSDDVAGRDSLYVCSVFTICDGGVCGRAKGDDCIVDNQCTSGRCKGRLGFKTCK